MVQLYNHSSFSAPLQLPSNKLLFVNIHNTPSVYLILVQKIPLLECRAHWRFPASHIPRINDRMAVQKDQFRQCKNDVNVKAFSSQAVALHEVGAHDWGAHRVIFSEKRMVCHVQHTCIITAVVSRVLWHVHSHVNFWWELCYFRWKMRTVVEFWMVSF